MELKNKIDFAIIITAEKCNPNGDPTTFNRPRIDFEGHGEITDVCLKRKIRNQLQDQGERIFVQENGRIDDGCLSLRQRAQKCSALEKEISKKKNANVELCKQLACKEWFDVRAFGQIFAFKGTEASFSVRGPVSIGIARTLEPILIEDRTIIKSTNTNEITGKDSNTMGRRYSVLRGVYVAYGSIFPQLAGKNGFSEEDSQKIKESLKNILQNDASATRPSGSMTSFLYWWEHSKPNGNLPSARVFKTLNIQPSKTWPYFSTDPEEIPGVTLETF